MAFFALGLERVTIYSNREWFSSAEVRFHSFVSHEQLSLPGAQALLDANTSQQRRTVVQGLAKDVIGLWETVNVENIPDRHTFEFGDTGRVLYRSNIIPISLDWFMLVIDDDSDIRNIGERLDSFLTNDRVDSIANAIISLAGAGGNPAAAAGIVLGKQLLKGISFVLKGNSDDQIGVVEQSFIRPLHYPNGSRHGIGVQDLTGNMWYDYFIYGLADD